jgi:hypothetical protein
VPASSSCRGQSCESLRCRGAPFCAGAVLRLRAIRRGGSAGRCGERRPGWFRAVPEHDRADKRAAASSQFLHRRDVRASASLSRSWASPRASFNRHFRQLTTDRLRKFSCGSGLAACARMPGARRREARLGAAARSDARHQTAAQMPFRVRVFCVGRCRCGDQARRDDPAGRRSPTPKPTACPLLSACRPHLKNSTAVRLGAGCKRTGLG